MKHAVLIQLIAMMLLLPAAVFADVQSYTINGGRIVSGGAAVASDVSGMSASAIVIGQSAFSPSGGGSSLDYKSKPVAAIAEYTAIASISGIFPSLGPTSGGTTVTITGTNLTTATAVKFGSTNAADFTVHSDTQITATSPAGSGTVNITIITLGGTSATSSSDQFTYVPAPTIANLDNDTMSYLIGSGTKVIDQVPTAYVTDSGISNFYGGTLTVSINSATGNDVLGVRDQGVGSSNVSLNGNDVYYGTKKIGTLSFAFVSGTATLTVSLNTTDATLAAVSALLNNITYANTSLASVTSRSVGFTVSNGIGGTSAASTVTITLTRPGFHVLWG